MTEGAVSPERSVKRRKRLADVRLIPDDSATGSQRLPPAPRHTRRPTALGLTALRSAAWLGPVLVVAAVMRAVNLGGTPVQTGQESAITARVWSLVDSGASGAGLTGNAAPPPLAWVPLAGWTALTRGFDRYDSAFGAVREPMVAAAVLSVLLLWAVARRLGLTLPAASAAALVVALSPLVISLQRVVSLDGVATPWFLLAVLGALSARRQLLGFAVAAAAIGIAVLSNPSMLLLVPLVAWLMIRGAHSQTRRYALALAASILVLVVGGSMVLAAVTSGLPAGPFATTAIEVRLPASGAPGSTAAFFSTDPLLLILAGAAVVVGLTDRRLRPLALTAGLLGAGVIALSNVPGAVAVPVLPVVVLVAVLIAGMAQRSVRALRHPGVQSGKMSHRAFGVIGVAVLLGAFLGAVPLWGHQLGTLLLTDRTLPPTSAGSWIAQNLPKNSRLLVDSTMWADLTRHGFSRGTAVWAEALDSDRRVQAQSPGGWQSFDFLATSPGSGAEADSQSESTARRNSTVVASFGAGSDRVEVRKIDPLGRDAAEQSLSQARASRVAAGTQLFQNPGLRAAAADRARLLDGAVDERITIMIGQLLAAGPVAVSGFPERDGEAGLLRRQVVVASVNGQPVVDDGRLTATGQNLRAALTGSFAPQGLAATSAGLTITFSILTPAGLVQ